MTFQLRDHVKFHNVDGLDLTGTISRIWNRPTSDPYITITRDDNGWTYVRASSTLRKVMYADNETVESIMHGFELVPNRVAAAAHFNYHPTLAAQRLSKELGWGNYLANAALRTLTQGEGELVTCQHSQSNTRLPGQRTHTMNTGFTNTMCTRNRAYSLDKRGAHSLIHSQLWRKPKQNTRTRKNRVADSGI